MKWKRSQIGFAKNQSNWSWLLSVDIYCRYLFTVATDSHVWSFFFIYIFSFLLYSNVNHFFFHQTEKKISPRSSLATELNKCHFIRRRRRLFCTIILIIVIIIIIFFFRWYFMIVVTVLSAEKLRTLFYVSLRIAKHSSKIYICLSEASRIK